MINYTDVPTFDVPTMVHVTKVAWKPCSAWKLMVRCMAMQASDADWDI